jgi:hypothetical protein
MSKRSTLLFQKERGHRVRIVMRHRSTLFVFTVEDGGGGGPSPMEKREGAGTGMARGERGGPRCGARRRAAHAW